MCACAACRWVLSAAQTEFVTAFRLAFPGEDAEATWTQIDKDKDGTLTLEELAEYYGFNMENDTAVEMDDEQILNALRVLTLRGERGTEGGRHTRLPPCCTRAHTGERRCT